MPPKSQSQKKPSSTFATSKLSALNFDRQPSKKPPSRPLVSVSKPPTFDIKGKAKAAEESALVIPRKTSDAGGGQKLCKDDDTRLWVDRYEPTTEAELAVHKRKVEDVRRWLMEAFEGGPSGKLRKYRRVLVLTGPAGTAKTATVRVLAREMEFGIQEWRNTVDESSFGFDTYERESLTQKFEAFLTRASTCRPLLSSSSSSHSSTSGHNQRQVILLEDLPNILHPPTQQTVHSILTSFVTSPSSEGVPLIMIISDAGRSGEERDEDIAGNSGLGSGKGVVDVRSAIPPGLLASPYLMQISFNPIAPTLLRRALQALLTRHAAENPSSSAATQSLGKEDLDMIVEASNGDIRSAIMALEFAYGVGAQSHSPVTSTKAPERKRGKKVAKAVVGDGAGTRRLLEAVTRKEHSLALFHLLGKVLYNKRKGDSPSSSLSAKDVARERALDAKVPTPPALPDWLSEHERRGSRIDVDTLYADSPVDTGLFSLYLHQNYTQFCDTLEQCDGIADWLSWVDSSGGERWHQANPHQFHLITLGTLHSLPSPVPRRAQKMYKPEYFAALKSTREADDAVADTRRWLRELASGIHMDDDAGEFEDPEEFTYNRRGMIATGWSNKEVVMELGVMLKLMGSDPNTIYSPPPTHRTFSAMTFHYGGTGTMRPLTDNAADNAEAEEHDDDDAYVSTADIPNTQQSSKASGYTKSRWTTALRAQDEGGRWLENDDIEEC